MDRCIRKWRPAAATLLELGCGTGRYSEAFADRGYAVVGVDRSAAMLRRAKKRIARRADISARVRLVEGDVRTHRDGASYDAVVALFHVMSYMETDDDLQAAFATASRHLKPGGAFAFDCWHGPGVLRDPPRNPVREIATRTLRAVRRTTARLDPGSPCVQVRFDIELWDQAVGEHRVFAEDHRMRYLFAAEIQRLGERAGLRLAAARPWLSDGPLDATAWYAFFVFLQGSAA